MNKKVLLMILDGWGKSSNPNACAITKAKPHISIHCTKSIQMQV